MAAAAGEEYSTKSVAIQDISSGIFCDKVGRRWLGDCCFAGDAIYPKDELAQVYGLPMNPQRGATLRQIAAAAGVSHTAVSLALRNDRSIPPATRDRIRAIAEELRYRPDPFVAALLSRVRSGRAPKLRAKLAFVNAFHDVARWRSSWTNVKFHSGAVERAQELGFEIEDFSPAVEGISDRRLSDILASRGIRGMVIGVLPGHGGDLDMAWDRFAVASQGYSMHHPETHRSCHYHWEGMIQCCERLQALGYRRIGLALTQEISARVHHLWLGAYESFYSARGAPKLPAYLDASPGIDRNGFLRWRKEYAPDVVITVHSAVMEWLTSAGFRIPKDLGIVHLDRHEEEHAGWAGIDQKAPVVGARAVDLVVEQIRNNEYGAPLRPKVVLTSGDWVMGSTVRPQSARRSKRKT